MFLVDASVWVCSGDPDDRFHAASRSVVLDFERPLSALDLTLYEIANVAARRGLPDEARRLARTVISRCRGSLLAIDADLAAEAAALAVEHGISAYDAAYVAAARRHGWTLVSADIRDLVSKGLAIAPDAADYP
jgi:predicted nucleic acid-binding protein